MASYFNLSYMSRGLLFVIGSRGRECCTTDFSAGSGLDSDAHTPPVAVKHPEGADDSVDGFVVWQGVPVDLGRQGTGSLHEATIRR